MPLKAYFGIVAPVLLALIWLSESFFGPPKQVSAGEPQVFRILTTQHSAPQPWRFERYVASFPGEAIEAMAAATPAPAAKNGQAKQANKKTTKVAAKRRNSQTRYADYGYGGGLGRGYDGYAQMRGGFGRYW